MLQSRINNSYRYFRRYFLDEIHYSSLHSSEISIVLALSANNDDGPSLSNDAIVTTEKDSGGFDYDIVRRRGPDAPCQTLPA